MMIACSVAQPLKMIRWRKRRTEVVIENSPRIARVSWLFPGFALSVCRLLGLDVGGSSTDSASTENQQQSNEFSHSVNKTRKPTHFFHYITPITINNPFSKSHRATALLLRRISSSGYPKNPNEAEPLINDEAIGFVSSRRMRRRKIGCYICTCCANRQTVSR